MVYRRDHEFLKGKVAAMVTFSSYPADPRPRRAVDALLDAGMQVDLICLADASGPAQGRIDGLSVLRVPIAHIRGGKLSYLWEYSAFIAIVCVVFAFRTLRRRYDLVHIHNMPDILVISGLVPKAFGAKVILDMHDPMPELMGTIFNRGEDSLSVRLLMRLEKWSLARAHAVITVNEAFQRLFASRSCKAEKIRIVMNAPDEKIFATNSEQPAPQDRRRHPGFAIMYHGSLVERNGADLAVDALAKVRRDLPDAELFIYGKRTLFLDKVMELARDKGVSESVHYLGPKTLEDVVRAIEDCDVGIIPNPRSAFSEINTPTRIFEFLAMGKPVIAPKTRGICDYFGAESLIFFEPGNTDDLAQKLAYVFAHPAEVGEIVKRGRDVLRRHSWARERQRFIELVSQLMHAGTT
jgi:glycosyltransferase involved in cell wall biosynthesis